MHYYSVSAPRSPRNLRGMNFGSDQFQTPSRCWHDGEGFGAIYRLAITWLRERKFIKHIRGQRRAEGSVIEFCIYGLWCKFTITDLLWYEHITRPCYVKEIEDLLKEKCLFVWPKSYERVELAPPTPQFHLSLFWDFFGLRMPKYDSHQYSTWKCYSVWQGQEAAPLDTQCTEIL